MSRPATPRARIAAQARFDTTTLLSNGEQLLVAIVLPAMALIAAVHAPYPDLGPGRRVDTVTPGILALAILSTAFTGQAISTAFDRRYGVLRLLGVTPLGRGGLLMGRFVAVLVIEAIQLVVLGGLAAALGWRPAGFGVLPALIFWLLGTACFVALAMLFAGTLRAEATLALANLVWVVLLAVGGVIVPASRLPAPWSSVVGRTPSAALADGFRAATETGSLAWGALAVLTGWTAVFAVAATRFFRWSD